MEGTETVEPVDPDRQALHQALDRVLDARCGDPGPVLSTAIESAHDLSMAIDGATVAVLADWEASGDWTHDGSSTPVTWLCTHTARGRRDAGALRRTALAVRGMPHVRKAADAGTLPLSHLHLLSRARKDEVADLFDRDEADLVAAAHHLHADGLRIHLHRWYLAALEEAQRNEPDADPDPHSGSDHLLIIAGFEGRGIVTGELSPEATAELNSAIDAEIDAWHRSGALDGDTRTRAELAAAALREIARRGARGGTSHGGPRPLVIATSTLTSLFDRARTPTEQRGTRRDDIVGGGPVAARAVRELLCDADVSLVITDDDAEPLFVGRAKRHATPAQVRGLIARSGGTCEHPACTATAAWCQAHHLAYWEHGASTDIDNLALLCTVHHRAIHQRGFTLTRETHGLVFRTPTGEVIAHRYT